MPRRKQVPSLEGLCLQNVAKNVTYHGAMFRNCPTETVALHYYILQQLFGDELLEKLFRIHIEGKDSETNLFTDFIFHGSNWDGANLSSCIKLIFHEYLKIINIDRCSRSERGKPSQKLMSYIFSECKGQQKLNLSGFELKEADFLRNVRNWKSLVKLNLSRTRCTDEMVIGIWEAVPGIQELSLQSCSEISDKCILYLCKNNRDRSELLVCRESLLCCKFGKELRDLKHDYASCCKLAKALTDLNLNYTRISKSGIMCALMHLPSLQNLEHTDASDPYYSYVTDAILRTVDACCKTSLSYPRLNLITTRFKRNTPESEMRCIIAACPNLKHLVLHVSEKQLGFLTKCCSPSVGSLHLNFTSPQIPDQPAFRNFLLEMGEQIRELGITFESGNFKTGHIIDIMKKCRNLKTLLIWNSNPIVLGGGEDIVQDVPILDNLNILRINGQVPNDEWHINVFMEIMNRTRNLSMLGVTSTSVAHALLRMVVTGNLDSLRILEIMRADMDGISMKPLVMRESNLETLRLVRCENTEICVKEISEIIRENNLSLCIICY